jgi:hypothetical protein
MLPTLRGVLHKPSSGYTPTDADAIAWLAATSSGVYTDAEKLAINTYITTLKAGANAWGTFDRVWVFFLGDTLTDSMRCLKSLQLMTRVNSLPWTRRSQFKGNNSGHLNSGFTPSTNGVNYTLSSASVGALIPQYDLTGSGSTYPTAFSVLSGTGLDLSMTRDANTSKHYVVVNGSTATTLTDNFGSGYYCLTRNNNTTLNQYFNASTSSISAPTRGIPTLPVTLFAESNSGSMRNFSSFGIAAFHVGAHMTTTQYTEFRNATETLKTAIGYIAP